MDLQNAVCQTRPVVCCGELCSGLNKQWLLVGERDGPWRVQEHCPYLCRITLLIREPRDADRPLPIQGQQLPLCPRPPPCEGQRSSPSRTTPIMDELADYQRELMPAAHNRLDEVMDESSRWTAEVRITPVPAVEQKIYLQLACPLDKGNRRTSPSVGRLARG